MSKFLLDYCTITGKSVKPYNGVKKYVATADIEVNEIINSTEVTYNDKPSRANQYIEENEIIFAKMKDTKKVLLATEKDIDNIYSTGFFVIKPNANVFPRYLFWYLNSNNFNQQKDKYSTGATMKAINNNGLTNIKLNEFPDYEIQKERSDFLDSISNAIKNRSKYIQDCYTMINSELKKIFDNTKEFKKISDLISNKKATKRDLEEKEWLLNLDAIEPNTGKVLFYNLVDKKELNGSISAFDKYDILYSKLRPYLNKVVLADKPGYGTTELVRVSVDPSIANKEYVFRVLLNDIFVDYISSKVAGAKMPRANLNEFWNYKIPYPTIEDQNRFATMIENIKCQILLAEKDLEDLTNLLNNKLDKYFKI